MEDLLNIVFIFAMVILALYYCYVFITFGEGWYKTKREFLFALLPYGEIIRGAIKRWKELK